MKNNFVLSAHLYTIKSATTDLCNEQISTNTIL